MKLIKPTRRLFLAVAPAIILAPSKADAWWQSIQQVAISGAPAGPSYTYRDSATTNSLTSAQTAFIDIGSASADRLVIVAVQSQNGPALTSVTVNGTSLNLDCDNGIGSGNLASAIFSGLITAGSGVATIVANWVSAGAFERNIFVWTATGLSSNVVKNTGTIVAGNVPSIIAVNAGDILIGGAYDNLGFPASFAGFSTQNPTGERTVGVTGQGADWLISATNASFSVNVDISTERAQKALASYR